MLESYCIEVKKYKFKSLTQMNKFYNFIYNIFIFTFNFKNKYGIQDYEKPI